MRRCAKKHGFPRCLKFPWGAPSNEQLNTYDADEVHHHGLIIDMVYDYYTTTRDTAFLAEFFEIVRGLARYIADSLAVKGPTGYELRPVLGECEKATLKLKGWKNETWTTATSCKGLRQYLEICNALGMDEPERDTFAKIADDFERIVKSNVDDDGVLYHYPPRLGYAAKEPSFTTLMHLPVLPHKPTVKKALSMFHAWSAWNNPWTSARISQACALRKDPLAWKVFDNVEKGANSFGGLVEHIQIEGGFHQEWYTTPHGAFIHALNIALVHELDGELRILPAVPPRMKELSFENLRTLTGLLVSVTVRGGKARLLKIQNDTPQNASVSLWVNKNYFKTKLPAEVQVKAGRTTRFEF